MAYCSNCGKELVEGAKFCFECGARVTGGSTPSTERRTVYDGEIHKCPNCGSLLNAFAIRCDMCGYELRGSNVSSVVREFADEIKRLEQEDGKASSNRIATHISTFPIPNTREELMEFLILSSSNISEDRYKEDTSKEEKAISDAWMAKFDQAYQKALLVFASAPELPQIKEIYEVKTKAIQKHKAKGFWNFTNLFPIGFGILALLMILVFSGIDRKETERLDALVVEVYAAIEDQNYDLARAKAVAVIWNGLEDEEKTENWDGVREGLLDAIDKAEQASSD